MSNHFPRSVMSVSRSEFSDHQDETSRLKLQIKSGELPSDIQGHVFVVGPAGSANSYQTSKGTVIPSHDGTTLLYNGDGMIYRFDFDQPEEGAFVSTSLVKPPCYYADLATQINPEFHGNSDCPDLRFQSIGVARLGKMGIRNQLNTAFLPMKFAGDDRERLLVTWDAGRPYEIDPTTLETITPVGWNTEWQPVSKVARLPWQPPMPFETVQTSAHPVFDPAQNGGEVITVNLGRSLSNTVSQLIPVTYLLKELFELGKRGWQRLFPKDLPTAIDQTVDAAIGKTVHNLEKGISPTPETFQDKLLILLGTLWQFINGIIHFFKGDFVDLIVWNGTDSLQKWQVRHQGKPIKIAQSIHQIGLTEDYIVLLDTAFKISTEELLPPLKNRNSHQIEAWVRNLLDKPQRAENHIYVIRRGDLKAGVATVSAQKIVLPLEAAHFVVDYKNPNDCITLHFSHVCAWDAAECVTQFDFSTDSTSADSIGTGSPHSQRPYGIIYNPTDISRLGCCTLKVTSTGLELVRPQSADIVMDTDLTWGPAIYAYRNGENYAQPDQVENLYWSCIGCWDELLKPHIEALYKDYPYRELTPEQIKAIAKEGRPSNLIRLQITPLAAVSVGERRLKIADFYQFDSTITVGSPQFIPAEGKSGSTEGYVFCIVHYGDGHETDKGNELWLFDAANLSQGPICKLWQPGIDFGFTVHSTWLQNIAPRTATYCVPPEADFKAVLEHPKQHAEVRDLFENWVFKQRTVA